MPATWDGRVASKLCSYNREASGAARGNPTPANAPAATPQKPRPHRSRRTPYSGYPGQAAHGCAAAASAHTDVRPSGDLETRSAAAPTEASASDVTPRRAPHRRASDELAPIPRMRPRRSQRSRRRQPRPRAPRSLPARCTGVPECGGPQRTPARPPESKKAARRRPFPWHGKAAMLNAPRRSPPRPVPAPGCVHRRPARA